MTDIPEANAAVIAAIPHNIRAEMARAGVNGRDVADHLGMAPTAFRRRQVNPALWGFLELAKLAAYLHVPIKALVGEQLAGSGTEETNR